MPPAAEAFFEDFFGVSDFDLDDQFLDDPFSDDPFSEDTIPMDTTPVEEHSPTTRSSGDTVPLDTDRRDAARSVLADPRRGGGQRVLPGGRGSGEVDAFAVPLEMLHPECGVAEAYWTGLRSMTDAEFFELIDAARPCFLGARRFRRDRGVRLPIEYTKPECFEGRNWYQVFDEPEYDERSRHLLGTDSSASPPRPRHAGRSQTRASLDDLVDRGSSTAPNNVSTVSAGLHDDHRRLQRDREAVVDRAGVVADLGERQAVAVDERRELGIGSRPQATPTNATSPAHRCAASSTEGASRLQVVQYGAQNHKTTGLPANVDTSISPPPTSGARNRSASGTDG